MAKREHLAIFKKGVKAWNKWRSGYNGAPDLRGADLRGKPPGRPMLHSMGLNGVDLSGTDLSRANLSAAYLFEADLSGASLVGARLAGASFLGAYLRHADLTGADLSGADLTEANLTSAKFVGADLTGAWVQGTIFAHNDLSEVKGLETVGHNGPSTISIDTIYRSHGNISQAFLRRAGVPDNFIEYMGSLTGKAIEFYSCFISYSTKDQEFADRLYADLQNKAVRCWFAPHEMRGGEHLIDQIDRAIRVHERVLLILSAESMKSKWVETEIVKARRREASENKRVLFPVGLVPFGAIREWACVDSDTGEDLAREIRRFYIPDFSAWKNHDSYAKGLEKLLGGLKAEGSRAA